MQSAARRRLTEEELRQINRPGRGKRPGGVWQFGVEFWLPQVELDTFCGSAAGCSHPFAGSRPGRGAWGKSRQW